MLAEGIKGGFAMLYDTFAKLETLGVCRRGYFIEGMGGAQFALPGAVERLRAARRGGDGGRPAAGARARRRRPRPALRCGAAVAEARGARAAARARRRRLRGDSSREQPVLYVERGGRGLITLARRRRPGRAAARGGSPDLLAEALAALADAVRAGACGKLSLERIDGEPAIASTFVERSSSSASRPVRGG